MATNTYTVIDTKTIGTATSSVTFTSIPQTYTDLVIVANFSSSTNGYSTMTFNGVTGTSYSRTRLLGGGGSASSDRANNEAGIVNLAYNIAGNPLTLIVDIFSYANTTTYKTILARDAAQTDNVALHSGMYRGSTGSSFDAISSVTLTKGSGNYAIGSTFSLYGISAVGTSPKATGGTISYGADGYTYHAFTSGSSSFIPSQALSCDVLIVAGGGGGMNGKSATYAGSGGGAGQVSGYTATAFASGVTHTVAIGGGGGAASSINVDGGTGTNTTITGSGFSTLTATGGGGGLYNTGAGGTSGNGYAGGSAAGGDSSGGGGGGATAVGAIWSSGAGGAGTSAFSQYGLATALGDNVSGTVSFGSGGNGQGGTLTNTKVAGGGGYRTSNKNGVANTGGGGAGGNDGPGNGGSGVVIIRYVS